MGDSPCAATWDVEAPIRLNLTESGSAKSHQKENRRIGHRFIVIDQDGLGCSGSSVVAMSRISQ
jgi:hypothetical protein